MKTELVPFQGQHIEGLQHDGRIWAVVRRICQNLGVDDDAQRAKLSSLEWAGAVLKQRLDGILAAVQAHDPADDLDQVTWGRCSPPCPARVRQGHAEAAGLLQRGVLPAGPPADRAGDVLRRRGGHRGRAAQEEVERERLRAREESMKTKDAVAAFNAGKRGPEITEALGKFDQGQPIWAEGKPLDITEALEVREHIESGGQAPTGHVTSVELCATKQKRAEADPSVRGVSLFKGVSTDAAQINWTGTTTDQRLLIALGVDEIHPRGPSIAERRALVQMLKSGHLPPEWAAVKKRLDKMTPGQKEALENERLHLQPRADMARASEPAAPVPGVNIHIGGSVVGGSIVAGNGNTVTPQASAVPLLLLYSASDAGAARDLAGHMFLMRRAGVVDLMDWNEIRAGAVAATERARMLGRAKIVVPLITSSALADPCILDAIDKAVERSARITPILVSDCMWAMTPWKDLVTMPRERKFISAWTDRNAAWAHCAEHLRALAVSLR